MSGAHVALGLLAQGAGQGYMNINLVPEEVVETMAMSKKKPWLVGAAAGFVLMGLTLIASEKVSARELARYSLVGEKEEQQAIALQKQYTVAQAETRKIESELNKLANSSVGRSLLLQVLPEVARVMPEEVVCPDVVLSWGGVQRASRRGAGGRGPTGGDSGRLPGMMGTGEGGMAPGMMGTGGGGMAPGMMMGTGRLRMAPGMRGALEGDTSGSGTRSGSGPGRSGRGLEDRGLKLSLDCEISETQVVNKQYIEQVLIKPLQELVFPDGEKMFQEVTLGNEPLKVIYRDPRDGTQRPVGIGRAAEKLKAFVKFRVQAVVNTGTAPRRRRARRR